MACTAPFIPPRSSQLQIQHAYQLLEPHIQYPLSFEYFTSCTLSAPMLPQDPKIQSFDLVDPSDLFLTSIVVSLFNQIIILHTVATIFITMSGNELRGPSIVEMEIDMGNHHPHSIETLHTTLKTLQMGTKRNRNTRTCRYHRKKHLTIGITSSHCPKEKCTR